MWLPWMLFGLLSAFSLTDRSAPSLYPSPACTDLAFTPKGDRFATVDSYGMINLFNLKDGSLSQRFDSGIEVRVYGIDISDDGKIAIGDESGYVHVLDLAGEKPLKKWKAMAGEVFRVRFSGKTISVAGRQDTVKTFSTADWQPLKTFPQNGACEGLAITPDQQYLVTGNGAGEMKVFDFGSGRELLRLNNPFKNNKGKRDLISAAVSPNGKLAATTGCGGKALLVDLQRRSLRGYFNSKQPFSIEVAFAPDNERLALMTLDGQVRVFDIETKAQLLKTDPSPADGLNFYVTFSPDGRYLVTCGPDVAIRIMDAASGLLMRRITYRELVE